MKFLRYLAHPTENSPDFAKVEGAYINCWVNTRSGVEATRIARRSIRDAGWMVEELEMITEVERSDLRRKSARESYDVALEKKWSITIHMWRRPRASKKKAPRGGKAKRTGRAAVGE